MSPNSSLSVARKPRRSRLTSRRLPRRGRPRGPGGFAEQRGTCPGDAGCVPPIEGWQSFVIMPMVTSIRLVEVFPWLTVQTRGVQEPGHEPVFPLNQLFVGASITRVTLAQDIRDDVTVTTTNPSTARCHQAWPRAGQCARSVVLSPLQLWPNISLWVSTQLRASSVTPS